MSDFTSKPSGSLARLGDYNLSSDDSDDNDNDEQETTALTSKPVNTDSADVSVTEASMNDEEGPSESKSSSEPASASAETEQTLDEDEQAERSEEQAERSEEQEERSEERLDGDDDDDDEDDDDDKESAAEEESAEVVEDDPDEPMEVEDEVKEEEGVKAEPEAEKALVVEDDAKHSEKTPRRGSAEPKEEENEEGGSSSDDRDDDDEEEEDESPAPKGDEDDAMEEGDEASASSDSKPEDVEEKTEVKADAGAKTKKDKKGSKRAVKKAKKADSSDEANSSDSNDEGDDAEGPDAEPEAEIVADESMDVSEKPDEDDEEHEDEEEEANGTIEMSDNPENPWETPKQSPVDGVVQPRTSPPRGKPTRHTNCLDFVLFTVVKDALKHKHSWPFQTPVDANRLEIPEYHNVVTKPMDLRTIERRLRNLYYWCAEDAIKDINQLFTNCYTFNPPEYDIYKMAKTLEKQVLSQLTQLPRSEKPADLADHHRRGMFPASTPNGKVKAPKQRGRKSTRGRKKASLPRAAAAAAAAAASAAKDESMDDMGDDGSSKVDSLNFDEEEDTVTEKDVESRADSVQPPEPVEEKTPAKTGKRKAENGDNGAVAAAKVSTPAPATPVATAAATITTPAPPRKNPNMLIDWKSLEPRHQGKPTDWQKFCSKLLTEIHSVRNKGFAQVFYQPVDPVKLRIFDYLDVITKPMDLHTIKKKLDFKQYIEPDEFANDMELMVNNCCTYNPKGSAAHQNALDMKTFFDIRWKMCPRPGTDPLIAESYITNNLVVNTDLVEEEKINSYINAVKAEEKKCAEKLETLRNTSEMLYNIAVQRREAKLAGLNAPTLAPSQLSQLDKLGITIKTPIPVMVPELISPALSVRSSSRAPVPKIIDDIGPSPIKARKISKPRVSTASSVAPVVVQAPPKSGRKKKTGRPKKPYSPALTPPHQHHHVHVPPPQPAPPPAPKPPPPPPPPFELKPYVSMYGRKVVGNADKVELSVKIGALEHEFITPVLRIIQIGQHNNGKKVTSLRSLCEEEIDFNDVPDDLIIELLDYLEMIKIDKTRAQRIQQELEVKARYYGFNEYDNMLEPISKKRKLASAPVAPRPRAESPSPSGRSSDSESDSSSSDSEPSRPSSSTRPPPAKRPLNISGGSSRASTPQNAPAARASVAASNNRPTSARPAAAEGHISQKPTSYTKRTLSESSSSSDDNRSSSDSSDSDSEPKPPPKKETAPPPKKRLVKKAPPPKKKAPLSILDELLPDTPGKAPVMAVPSTSTARPSVADTMQRKKTPPPPRISEEELRAQQEHEHNEALQRQAEARRRRALEEQPIIHQHEVMQAFESQYGDFSY